MYEWTDQQNRVGDPNIDPKTHRNLMSDKENISNGLRGGMDFTTNVLEKT